MATRRYRRDLKELESRRRKGMRMLARGVVQAEVARALEVSRQTASSWAKKLAEDPQAWRRRPLGRPAGLDASQKQLGKALLAGAVANDFPTELWTLARVAKLIKRQFGVAYSTVNVWRILREALGSPASVRRGARSSATRRRSNSGVASAGQR